LGPQPDTWTTFASGSGSKPKDVSGTLDLSGIPASFWDDAQNPYRMSVTKTLETTEQYTVSLRLQVIDNANASQPWGTGEERRSIAVHHDPSLLPGFPLRLGHGGESQAALVDLQGTGHLDLVFGDSDGYVHAIDPITRLELPGWPVHTFPTQVARPHAGITPGYEPILAPVAVGDLDHTGNLWVVATSTRGKVYVFDAAGHPDLVIRSQWTETTSTGDLAAGGAGFLHAYKPDGTLLWIGKMPSIVEYYGSAQEFLTEGAEDEAAAPVIPGGTDQVASGPVLSPSYLFNSDGSNATVYGPLPGSPTGVFLQNAAACIAAPSSCPYSRAELQNFLAGNLPA